MGTGNKKQAQTGLITQTPQTVINSRATLQIYQTANVYAPFRELVQRNGLEDVKQQIARALITGYEIAGVPPTNWPSDILKPIIREFILNNYAGFNENDILNAFLFAVEGRFGNLANPEAKGGLLELYNKPVSLVWISDILKSYSIYRAGELQKANQLVTRAATDPVAEHLKTRPLNNTAVREILIKTFADVMEGVNNTTFLLPEFYGFLEDNGLIELDTQEKRDIAGIAEKQLLEEKKDKNVSGGGFLAVAIGPDNVTDRAKKLAIIVMFEKFKVQGLDEFTVIGLFDRVCYLSPTAHRKLFAAQNQLNPG